MRRVLLLLALTVATAAAYSPVSALPLLPAAPPGGASYSVLQMNLCLSRQAGCWPRTAYPAVVDEAVGQVVQQDADAVTLNEACGGDAADIARRTGYRLRFAAILVGGARLPCVEPGHRGVFGVAVLTRAPVVASHSQAFAIHAGAEERRWLCVTTVSANHVCTAHLSTRDSTAASRANDAECGELRALLARYDARGPTVFGGDVNRQTPCAPTTMWATEDTFAAQLPGIQHIYGTRSRGDRPFVRVAPANHTDHDFLLTAFPSS